MVHGEDIIIIKIIKINNNNIPDNSNLFKCQGVSSLLANWDTTNPINSNKMLEESVSEQSREPTDSPHKVA